MVSDLYERIKVLCAEKGVSINKMLLAVGVDRKTVHRWRFDGVSPRQSSLDAVADFLGVNSGFLLYGEGQMPDFPRRLKRMRMERGLTKKELAAALGCSANSIYNWESGRVMPSKFVVELLAHFFGVSYETMRYGSGE